MNKLYKRLLISTGVGMVLGVFCIIGQSQRMPSDPLPSETIYLFHAWYNRLMMGVLIGLAGQWEIMKSNSIVNAIIRGAILGTLVSASFGLLGQSLALTYFFAGIVYGIIIDGLSTWILSRKTSSN